MNKYLRLTALAATAATMALTSAPALAQVAPNQNATARARVLRPLTLTWVRNFDLGTIVLSGAAPFSATVSLSQAGALTCPASVTCSGATSTARYNVRGTNNQVVLISAPNVTLSDGSGNNLLLSVSAPPSVTLTSSGAPGDDFDIGGSITVSDTTVDGVYTGTFNVTAQYQ